MESFGRLFKNRVRLYVYPMGDPVTGKLLGLDQARVTIEQRHLLRYIVAKGCVIDITETKHDYLFQTSAEVRNMIKAGDPRWRDLVPEIVLNQGPWAAMQMQE